MAKWAQANLSRLGMKPPGWMWNMGDGEQVGEKQVPKINGHASDMEVAKKSRRAAKEPINGISD